MSAGLECASAAATSSVLPCRPPRQNLCGKENLKKICQKMCCLANLSQPVYIPATQSDFCVQKCCFKIIFRKTELFRRRGNPKIEECNFFLLWKFIQESPDPCVFGHKLTIQIKTKYTWFAYSCVRHIQVLHIAACKGFQG